MTRFVLTRPVVTLVAGLLVTIALGVAAAGVRFDNTPDTWLPTVGDDLAEYERFRDRYGEDSLIVAVAEEPGLRDPERRRAFAELADALRALPGVSWVEAPERVDTDEGPAELRSVFSSPLARHLENADGSRAGVALFPEPELDAQQRSALVADLESLLAGWTARIGTLRLAGADVITHDLDRGSQRSLGGLSPLVFATMCLVFFLATRSLAAVGAMLLAVIAASVWTLGLVALAERTLNLVVVVMPAILAVVTAAQATHLLSRFFALEVGDMVSADRADRVRWWRRATEACWRPCLLSAVTTAAGFASLAASEIPPVRDLGAFTAAGVLFSFVLTFSVVPALLVLTRRVHPRRVAARWWTPARATAITAVIRRHAVATVLVAASLSAVCAIGLGRLELESHILRFFPPDHRIPTNYEDIEANLLGLTPFELEIEGDRERVLSAETLLAFDRILEEALREEALLQQALSPLVAKSPAPPAGLRAARLDAALPADGDELPDSLRRFVWIAGDRLALRTTLAARTASSNDCDALIQRLRQRLDGIFPEGVDARITGAATLLIHGQVLLLDTQLRSFAFALAAVTLVIALVFRSFSVVCVSLLPNLMPIAVTLGLMGLAGVPLDTATVTVAGIALGLIVDDTIHFLHGYWQSRRAGKLASAAVADTLFTVGRPVLVTSLAVAAGFGAFAFSPFRPTLFFGLLIAWSSLAAVFCDLVVLPALLQLRRRDPDPAPRVQPAGAPRSRRKPSRSRFA
ncbi:MAG: MMPL family transporter [Myxococcota bacterium]|nr:MMPL family transporter [Myxococcota bacterium]